MGSQLSDAVITVNDDVIGIVPGSLVLTEGRGTQKVLPVSEGSGRVSQVFANDLETNFGAVRFSLRSTVANIKKALSWKEKGNTNVIGVAMEDSDGSDSIRTFTQIALVNDYEIMIQAEGAIDLEFMGNAPI